MYGAIQRSYGNGAAMRVTAIGYAFDSRASYSVPPAIVAFLESENYEDAIRKAVSIGGDNDTIACMAGAVAEAYYKEIPNEILEMGKGFLDMELKK